MPSRFTAQSGKGVLLVALALVATLLVPSVYTWAVKPGAAKPGIIPSGLQDERILMPRRWPISSGSRPRIGAGR